MMATRHGLRSFTDIHLAAIGFTILCTFFSGCTVFGVSPSVAASTATATANSDATTVVVNTPASCGDVVDYSSVPDTPTAIPGPMAAHVMATTSAGPPPSAPTTHFQAGQPATVVITIHDVPAGESHVISAAWYFNDQPVGPAQPLQQTIAGDGIVFFRLLLTTHPGVGRVQVYVDLPQSDATLAQTLTFGLYC
jgi:hypothetical protein